MARSWRETMRPAWRNDQIIQGEEDNSKCPRLRLGKNVLKNWRRAGPLNAQVRFPPLSTSAWGPWDQVEAELRAPASPKLQGGDPGEVFWGDSASATPAPHTPLPGTGALPFACSPASTWPEHKACLGLLSNPFDPAHMSWSSSSCIT